MTPSSHASWLSPPLVAALAAQGCAFLNAATGVASEYLALAGVDAAAFQSLLNYLLLGAVYGGLHLRAHGWALPRLSSPLRSYALLALVDVEANFLIVKALQYTSLTSVSLLDCASVPAAMLLSRRAYSRRQLASACVVLLGLAALLASDALCHADGGRPASHPLLGDALTVLAASLYACSNVLQERLLAASPRCEVLASLGGLGAVLAGVQCLALERVSLSRAFARSGAALAPGLLGFTLSMFCIYSLCPLALGPGGGAAAFNLHMLSSDVWAAAARALLFGGFGGGCAAAGFGGSLLAVAAGLVGFAWSGKGAPAGGGGGVEEEGQSGEEAGLLQEERGEDREQMAVS